MKRQVKKLIVSLLLVSVFSILSCSQLSLLNREPETAEDYKYYGKKYKDVVDAVKFCHKHEDDLQKFLVSYLWDKKEHKNAYTAIQLINDYKELRGSATIDEIKMDDKIYMLMNYEHNSYSKLSEHAEYCDNLYEYNKDLEEFIGKKSVKLKQLQKLKAQYLSGVTYLKKLSNIPEVQVALIDTYRRIDQEREKYENGKYHAERYDPDNASVDYGEYFTFRSPESVERQYKYCTYEYNGLNEYQDNGPYKRNFCYGDGLFEGDFEVYSKLGKLTANETKFFNENRAGINKEIAEIEKNKDRIYNYKERLESLNQAMRKLTLLEGKIKYLRFTNKIGDYYSSTRSSIDSQIKLLDNRTGALYDKKEIKSRKQSLNTLNFLEGKSRTMGEHFILLLYFLK